MRRGAPDESEPRGDRSREEQSEAGRRELSQQAGGEDERVDEHEVPAQRGEDQVARTSGIPGRDREGAGDEDGPAVEDEPDDQRTHVMAAASSPTA